MKWLVLTALVVALAIPEASEARLVCRATGDPHYTPFVGRYFDWYGMGEQLLMRRRSRGVTDEIHTIVTRFWQYWRGNSLAQGFAWRVGKDTLEITVDNFKNPRRFWMYVNGKKQRGGIPAHASAGPLRFRRINHIHGVFSNIKTGVSANVYYRVWNGGRGWADYMDIYIRKPNHNRDGQGFCYGRAVTVPKRLSFFPPGVRKGVRWNVKSYKRHTTLIHACKTTHQVNAAKRSCKFVRKAAARHNCEVDWCVAKTRNAKNAVLKEYRDENKVFPSMGCKTMVKWYHQRLTAAFKIRRKLYSQHTAAGRGGLRRLARHIKGWLKHVSKTCRGKWTRCKNNVLHHSRALTNYIAHCTKPGKRCNLHHARALRRSGRAANRKTCGIKPWRKIVKRLHWLLARQKRWNQAKQRRINQLRHKHAAAKARHAAALRRLAHAKRAHAAAKRAAAARAAAALRNQRAHHNRQKAALRRQIAAAKAAAARAAHRARVAALKARHANAATKRRLHAQIRAAKAAQRRHAHLAAVRLHALRRQNAAHKLAVNRLKFKHAQKLAATHRKHRKAMSAAAARHRRKIALQKAAHAKKLEAQARKHRATLAKRLAHQKRVAAAKLARVRKAGARNMRKIHARLRAARAHARRLKAKHGRKVAALRHKMMARVQHLNALAARERARQRAHLNRVKFALGHRINVLKNQFAHARRQQAAAHARTVAALKAAHARKVFLMKLKHLAKARAARRALRKHKRKHAKKVAALKKSKAAALRKQAAKFRKAAAHLRHKHRVKLHNTIKKLQKQSAAARKKDAAAAAKALRDAIRIAKAKHLAHLRKSLNILHRRYAHLIRGIRLKHRNFVKRVVKKHRQTVKYWKAQVKAANLRGVAASKKAAARLASSRKAASKKLAEVKKHYVNKLHTQSKSAAKRLHTQSKSAAKRLAHRVALCKKAAHRAAAVVRKLKGKLRYNIRQHQHFMRIMTLMYKDLKKSKVKQKRQVATAMQLFFPSLVKRAYHHNNAIKALKIQLHGLRKKLATMNKALASITSSKYRAPILKDRAKLVHKINAVKAKIGNLQSVTLNSFHKKSRAIAAAHLHRLHLGRKATYHKLVGYLQRHWHYHRLSRSHSVHRYRYAKLSRHYKHAFNKGLRKAPYKVRKQIRTKLAKVRAAYGKYQYWVSRYKALMKRTATHKIRFARLSAIHHRDRWSKKVKKAVAVLKRYDP